MNGGREAANFLLFVPEFSDVFRNSDQHQRRTDFIKDRSFYSSQEAAADSWTGDDFFRNYDGFPALEIFFVFFAELAGLGCAKEIKSVRPRTSADLRPKRTSQALFQ